MKKLFFLLFLVIAGWFLLRNCGSQKQVTQTPPPAAVAPGAPNAIPQADAISGSSLNKAFPAPADGYTITFTQEKDGYAQADLAKGGAKAASLSISDTAANPSARDKFNKSTRQIGGFPAAAVGSQGTAVLVAGRYQVQVRSQSPAFTQADRDAWLARFKLAALANAR